MNPNNKVSIKLVTLVAAGVGLAALGCFIGAFITLQLWQSPSEEHPNKWAIEQAEMAAIEAGVIDEDTTTKDSIKAVQPAPKSMPRFKDELPRYISNANKSFTPNGKPMIAIVLDDLGERPHLSDRAITELPAEITLSFLPYPKSTPELATKAKMLGHEIMVHMPMEPKHRGPEEPSVNPGPMALRVNQDFNTIRLNTHENLKLLADIAVGTNNHMGSGFTAYQEGMEEVLKIVDAEKLFFMDSLTTADSKVSQAAQNIAPNMPLLVRDIFLDHYINREKTDESLAKLETKALNNGAAIAIGHPHKITIEALKNWVGTLEEKGFQLVPITALISQKR